MSTIHTFSTYIFSNGDLFCSTFLRHKTSATIVLPVKWAVYLAWLLSVATGSNGVAQNENWRCNNNSIQWTSLTRTFQRASSLCWRRDNGLHVKFGAKRWNEDIFKKNTNPTTIVPHVAIIYYSIYYELIRHVFLFSATTYYFNLDSWMGPTNMAPGDKKTWANTYSTL